MQVEMQIGGNRFSAEGDDEAVEKMFRAWRGLYKAQPRTPAQPNGGTFVPPPGIPIIEPNEPEAEPPPEF